MDHDDSAECCNGLGTSNSLAGGATPVLGLTRRGDLQTKLRAFELGVDDILTVPFSPEELLARSHRHHAARLGDRSPHRADDQARRDGDRHRPSRRFVPAPRSSTSPASSRASCTSSPAAAGRVVTRDEILDAIWGTDFVAESNIVDRHIRSLRIKLQNDYRHPRFIATVPGRGIGSSRRSPMRDGPVATKQTTIAIGRVTPPPNDDSS